MKKLLNYVNFGVVFELLRSITGSVIVVLYFKLEYNLVPVFIALDLFFLNVTNFNFSSFSRFPIINSLTNVFIPPIFRVLLLSFFIFTIEIAINVDTCSYDAVLRWLVTFISIYFFFNSVATSALIDKKPYLKLIVMSLECSIAIFLALFFLFGFFKLFFAKYMLLAAFGLAFLFLIAVRCLIISFNKSNLKKKNK